MSPAAAITSPRGDDQVTELQADNTRLLNEARMWKRRYEAARAVMDFIFLGGPIASKMIESLNPVPETDVDMFLVGLRELHARADLLEKDAWTSINGHVRKFIESVKESHLEKMDVVGIHEFVKSWVDIFKDALG